MDDKKGSWAVPVAIIICILLIAGAVYYKDKAAPADASANNNGSATTTGSIGQILHPAEGINLTKLRAIDDTDNLRGSADAPIKLIVYTDPEAEVVGVVEGGGYLRYFF